MDSVTPKWAREAQEHLVKLSRRLDATEALCDELVAALFDLRFAHLPSEWDAAIKRADAVLSKAKGK